MTSPSAPKKEVEITYENNATESHQNKEIMCLYHKLNRAAVASYNLDTQEIKVLETCDNFPPDYLGIQSISKMLSNRIILVNSNLPYDLYLMLQKIIEANSGSSTFQKISSSLFNYGNSKKTISNTKFFNHEKGYYVHVSSVVDLADERLVCAAGVLFSYLKEELKIITVATIGVNQISHLRIGFNLWMDGETHKSLQIFDTVQHPSNFKLTSQDNIEGFSVFSIIEKHCTYIGSTKLRALLASPTMNINVIKMRHEVIRFYLNPANADIIHQLKYYISRLSPPTILMAIVECTNIRGKHWKSIYQNIYYSVLLAEVCSEYVNDVEMFSQLKECITDEMYAMAYHLNRVIDFESIEGNETFVVKPGVCKSLEEAKRRFYKLMEAINNVVPYEFDSVPDYVKQIHIIYIPEMKFLLGIPYWKKGLTKEELLLPGLDYKFTSNNTGYYKSKRCYELDELLGDPQIEILTEESNIIKALGNYIRKHIHCTIDLLEKIGDLDCILAMATLAKEQDYTEPILTVNKILSIKDGIHPLLKMFNNNTVPNSICSSSNNSLIKVVFGPNSSGKTVYLKQVALLAYLSHIGSYIPASEAHIGILHHIHSRIFQSETVISNSSTFMQALGRLVTIVCNSSSGSLLILDEVGKGTTELNGVAILAGCLNHFLSLEDNSPHIIISTHLDTVTDYIKDNSLFSTHETNYIVEDSNLTYLYEIKQTRNSNHTGDVSLLQVPNFIASTANRVLVALRKGVNVIPYTNLRVQRSERYYSFLKKFTKMDQTNRKNINMIKKQLQSL